MGADSSAASALKAAGFEGVRMWISRGQQVVVSGCAIP